MTDRGDEQESSEHGSGDELRPEDVERRFNELVKNLGDTDPGLVKELEAETGPAQSEPAPPPTPPEEEPTLLELWDADLPDDEEDEYEPPEPPPVPWPNLQAIGGILLIIAGLVMLINPGIAPLGTNPGRLVGFIGFLIGVWLLISLLRPGDPDDEPDDGAVV